MDDNGLVAVDLRYRDSINFTYERDGSSVSSWIDHILCDTALADRISNVRRLDSGSNLSDHPIVFCVDFSSSGTQSSISSNGHPFPRCLWFKSTAYDLELYRNLVAASLPFLSDDVLNCCDVHCTRHSIVLDQWCEQLCFFVIIC